MSAQYFENVWNRLMQASPPEALWGLLSSPVVTLVLAAVIAVVLARSSVRSGAVHPVAGQRGEQIALGAVALATAGAWIVDVILRGYVFDVPATVSWWRFAVAPTAAAIGLAALATTMRTPTIRRLVDAASVTRRTWRSFGPRRGIPLFAGVASVSIAATVMFGGMSTAVEPGVATHLVLDIPNTDDAPVVAPFPGWAYGLPFLIATVLMVAALALLLQRNAARSYPDGITVEAERRRRTSLARDAVATASAATLIGLAGVLRMARSAAVASVTLSSDGVPGVARQVNLPHADLIVVGGFLAPFLETGACVVLVVIAVRASLLLLRAAPTDSTARAGERR